MNTSSVGFVGGGRIARILLEGWKHKDALPARIVVSEPHEETLARLRDRFPSVQPASDNAAAAAQDIVFLAVHPPAMMDATASVKGALRAEAVLVSLAPKFTIAKLTDLLGGFARIARVIPNAPSIVGLGFNPVTFGAALDAEDRATIASMFAPLGEGPVVAEEALEAYAVLSAMGPTYFWFQLQALRDVAVGFGLDDSEIARALKRTVCGATRTLLESGLTSAEVMDLIPVKPLAEMEPQVGEMYRTRLPNIYQKIKP